MGQVIIVIALLCQAGGDSNNWQSRQRYQKNCATELLRCVNNDTHPLPQIRLERCLDKDAG